MLEHLNNHFNQTTTENGAKAFKSTKSAVLDLFSQGGAMRANSDAEVASIFSKAFNENPTLALKTLFYLRDIRGTGQGERRFFRVALKHMALHHKESLKKNLHLVSEYGRWDDLLGLLDTDVRSSVALILGDQLVTDSKSELPSLLAKWLPSENASSETTKRHARILIKEFNISPRDYRKMLSQLRSKIGIVETLLTEKKYAHIRYDQLPSVAGMKYRTAFFRNDEDRYRAFLDSLEKGEVKVNAGTLYPSDIVGKIVDTGTYYRHLSVTAQEIQLFEGQWRNLPDFIGEKAENSLVMADVSGSMSGTPMNVSIALAMYIAERNKGLYHNHFMTFTDQPAIVAIQGGNIVEKVQNISSRVGYSTDIQKALQTVLNVAVNNKLSNDEVVKKLYIISDMQFDDYSISGTSVHIFKTMKQRFEDAGYDFPNIVFWNVRAAGNTPMQMNDAGVQLVSGYSPSIMKQLLSSDGKTPYDFMLEVLLSERYADVTA